MDTNKYVKSIERIIGEHQSACCADCGSKEGIVMKSAIQWVGFTRRDRRTYQCEANQIHAAHLIVYLLGEWKEIHLFGSKVQVSMAPEYWGEE